MLPGIIIFIKPRQRQNTHTHTRHSERRNGGLYAHLHVFLVIYILLSVIFPPFLLSSSPQLPLPLVLLLRLFHRVISFSCSVYGDTSSFWSSFPTPSSPLSPPHCLRLPSLPHSQSALTFPHVLSSPFPPLRPILILFIIHRLLLSFFLPATHYYLSLHLLLIQSLKLVHYSHTNQVSSLSSPCTVLITLLSLIYRAHQPACQSNCLPTSLTAFLPAKLYTIHSILPIVVKVIASILCKYCAFTIPVYLFKRCDTLLWKSIHGFTQKYINFEIILKCLD